jgi:LPXTG-motif cell wall-anchored protein
MTDSSFRRTRPLGRITAVAALAATATATLTLADHASAVGINDCEIRIDNTVIYPDQSTDGPFTATFTFDTSIESNFNQGGDYYIWWGAEGSGSRTSGPSLVQTTSVNPWQRSYGQVLNDIWTSPLTAEPVAGSVAVTATSTLSNTICRATYTLLPNAAPTAPTAVTPVPGDGEVTVSWTAWRDFEGQTYTVTAAPGGATCTVEHPATSCTVDGLDNDTPYTFSVVTTTTGGSSDPSAPSASVTPQAAPTTTVETTVPGGPDTTTPDDPNPGAGEPPATDVELPATGSGAVSTTVMALLAVLLGGVAVGTTRFRRSGR